MLRRAATSGVGKLLDDAQLDGGAHRLGQAGQRGGDLAAQLAQAGALLDLGDQRLVGVRALDAQPAQRAALGAAAAVVEGELALGDRVQPGGGLIVGGAPVSGAGPRPPWANVSAHRSSAVCVSAVRRTNHVSRVARCRA